MQSTIPLYPISLAHQSSKYTCTHLPALFLNFQSVLTCQPPCSMLASPSVLMRRVLCSLLTWLVVANVPGGLLFSLMSDNHPCTISHHFPPMFDRHSCTISLHFAPISDIHSCTISLHFVPITDIHSCTISVHFVPISDKHSCTVSPDFAPISYRNSRTFLTCPAYIRVPDCPLTGCRPCMGWALLVQLAL